MKRLEDFRQRWLPVVEQTMQQAIEALPSHQERMKRAMLHALQSGGKRVRPLLVLLVAQLSKRDVSSFVPVASALEMIHTYSLIHDDLPSMDDDDMRRGKPTVHVAFDEATAVLAGDAFLTMAFEQLASAQLSAEEKVQYVMLLSQAAGAQGMIAGQMLDIEFEKKQATIEQLRIIHEEKTGRLLQFATKIAANSPVDATTVLAVEEFGKHFGLAFQIQNDLQDVLWSSEKAGKKTKRDGELLKSTYPSLLGVEGAKQALLYEIQQAIAQMERITLENEMQKEAVEMLLEMLAYVQIEG